MIAGELTTMAMHELRDKARLGIARAQAGTPVMVFVHGDPAAVLLSSSEASRWVDIERSLSALHGLDVYPELADDTSALAGILAGRDRPSPAALRRLSKERREIVAVPRTIGITEIQRRLASILDEIGEGRPTTVTDRGEFAAVFITPAEYYRLRRLSRIVAWFRTAGLDLATATADTISAFVARYRDTTGAASAQSTEEAAG